MSSKQIINRNKSNKNKLNTKNANNPYKVTNSIDLISKTWFCSIIKRFLISYGWTSKTALISEFNPAI